ncbi:MAG: hypothetical protein COY11_02010 [Candidatus Portnoybacteria bacterium CG_4_10_14_0_2_um_filter_44_20]|uniref:Uncharacterized protein n=1 Tax=Candidatus Portnoybacteria bacterium CG_4_10_14_0_2_um_filter_44_20 TaxID=1974799 RepID=A0A2M7UI58_9BACT|nr:MAG: hypothetical protein COY11_02010 [Candidatus Portnoybacteria bacterium CG_4_10_14_0_2_um_filter_44_20]
MGEFEGENFCQPAHRAEGATGVGAAPLSCSVKISKAKHFSIHFRKKFCVRLIKRKREKCFALRRRQTGGAAGRVLRSSGRRLSLKEGSRIFKQRALIILIIK